MRPTQVTTPGSARRAVLLLLTSTVVALWLALAWTLPADAHSELVATRPESGATTVGPVERVTLTFSSHLVPELADVVVARDDTRLDTGRPVVTGVSVDVPVEPLVPGEYDVAYRAVAADGHVIAGSYSFRVSRTGEGRSSVARSPDGDVGAPPAEGTALQVVTVVGVSTLVVLGLLRRRRRDLRSG